MSVGKEAPAPEGRPEPKGRLKPPAPIKTTWRAPRKPPAPITNAAAAVTPASYRHQSLRNPAINYRAGWWAVTVQVAKNKSLLGAIVGERVALNALGRAVESYWRALPAKYPGLELFDFVVMPNHFHALLRIRPGAANQDHQLGFLMSRFKGGTSFIYGKMRRAGKIEDVGGRLWQRDYWDDLVSSEVEFRAWQRYIRENPAHWSSDRYGACAAYAQGNIELLNRPRVAFVASQGFYASALKPRKIWAKGATGAKGAAKAARSDKADKADRAARSDTGDKADRAARSDTGDRADRAARADNADRVLISTFTSAQEREALRRALAKKRPLIAVFPAGIPGEGEMAADLAAAICAGWALAVSPQAPRSRLNKKIATWCNEFVLKNADEIWAGDLSPNGMLMQMLTGLSKCAASAVQKGGL